MLVGNSAFFLKEYDYVAKLLQNVSGLDITFMCSYGRPNPEIYNEWKMQIKQNLEPNNIVSFWEENIPINEYNRRIGEYRVYIAGMERQSGLGAITTAIGSGLKVYITGVNYDYFSEKGLSVCKLEELQEINFDKLLYFNEKDKQENIANVKKVCGVNESFSDWERIYDSL